MPAGAAGLMEGGAASSGWVQSQRARSVPMHRGSPLGSTLSLGYNIKNKSPIGYIVKTELNMQLGVWDYSASLVQSPGKSW